MKLKILPTHLREKKRYLAFEAISQLPLKREDVISLLWDTSLHMYGVCGTSKFDLWVVKIWNCPDSDYNRIRGIIRCRRESLDEVRAILPVVTRFNGKKVVFYTRGISGTINSAVKKFIKLKEEDE
ncbi:ribonuclease P [Methanobacterium sp. CWC-01]|uniref:Rpp14/Pop5 family protein n=1 Tax=Methanobacterium aridiramus TaxID=2584467 RepID=UPI002576DB4D|nr:Rpp14/Pop5 family protein [Methanobacterium sp. CWC-01]WJI09041.1 ribonuclease P [Methanobacterium sp. CWC-01]